MRPAPPPENLGAEERLVWWHTMGLLQELGTLGIATAEELAEYCRALARMRQTVKQRDFDQFARDSETMLRFASKCGMTPASRARLGIVWTDRGWRRRRAPYQKLTGRETPPERREENEEAESDDDA